MKNFTHTVDPLATQLLESHLISDVTQVVGLFSDASDKSGFKHCPFLHDMLYFFL